MEELLETHQREAEQGMDSGLREQLLGPGDLEALGELKQEAQEQGDWSVSYA